MFKRAVWTGVGFGLGLGSSYWVKRAARRRVERHVPDPVRRSAARVGRNVGGAVREGRAAMRRYQSEADAALREQEATDSGRSHLRSVRGTA